MKGVSSILVFSLLVTCSAGLFDFLRPDTWNDLKIRWGVNPFSSSNFKSLPRTVEAATADGYQLISSCDTTVPWRGNRYIKDNDYSVTLLYDVNGIIAGIQTSFTSEQGQGYPAAAIQPPFVRDGDRYVLSAYFVDPSIICTTGRSQAQLDDEGTGTGLYVQFTDDPDQSTLIPRQESDIAAPWVRGKCFRTMGVHYWYDVSVNMNCDNAVPLFLLYNGGELNAFGWFLVHNFQGDDYEHPPPSVFGSFIETVPTCLRNTQISTLHIFLTSTPWFNFC